MHTEGDEGVPLAEAAPVHSLDAQGRRLSPGGRPVRRIDTDVPANTVDVTVLCAHKKPVRNLD